MIKIKEQSSAFINKAIDTLFVLNPKGTSFGVLLGFCIDTIIKLFNPFLKTLSSMDFTKIGPIRWAIFGVVITNVPFLFKRPKFDEGIEGAFAFIKEAQRSKKLSDFEIRQMYRRLYVKVLDKVTLDDPTNQRKNELEKILNDSDINLPE